MDELGVLILLGFGAVFAFGLTRFNPIFGYSRGRQLKIVALALLAAALMIGVALHHVPLLPASGVTAP
jgi:hypothetical protein